MPDPADLLEVARLLLSAGPASPSEAQLRRAVSTAYYAVFHKVVRTGTARLLGSGREATAAFGLVYRSFTHARMKEVCRSIDVAVLSPALHRSLQRPTVSQEMRDFANAFPGLQEQRHLADYDPSAAFNLEDCVGLIDAAAQAMRDFDKVSHQEQMDIVALMLSRPRP